MDKFPCCFYCSTKPSGRRGNKNSSQSTADKHPCEIPAGWKWKCFRAEMHLPFSQTDNCTLLQPPWKSLLCGEEGDSAGLSPHQSEWVNATKKLELPGRVGVAWQGCVPHWEPALVVVCSSRMPPWIWKGDQEGRHIGCVYININFYRKYGVVPTVACCSAALTNHAPLDARTSFH